MNPLQQARAVYYAACFIVGASYFAMLIAFHGGHPWYGMFWLTCMALALGSCWITWQITQGRL